MKAEATVKRIKAETDKQKGYFSRLIDKLGIGANDRQ